MIEGALLAILAGLLSIIGLVIANSLQQRAWEVQHRRSIEDAQLLRAQQLCDKLVELSDKRIYRLRRLIWASRPGSLLNPDDTRADYSLAVFAWNDNFNSIRANLLSLYGYSRVQEFEYSLHAPFQNLGARLEKAIRDGQPADQQLEQSVNVLSKNAYAFFARLQQEVRDRSLTHFEKRDQITFTNVDRLPLMYLVKRLYGISTKMRGI